MPRWFQKLWPSLHLSPSGAFFRVPSLRVCRLSRQLWELAAWILSYKEQLFTEGLLCTQSAWSQATPECPGTSPVEGRDRGEDLVVITLAKHGGAFLLSERVNTSSPPLLEDALLNLLGKKYKKTAAQIALRFNIQRGVVVIPKSFNPARIKENFQVRELAFGNVKIWVCLLPLLAENFTLTHWEAILCCFIACSFLSLLPHLFIIRITCRFLRCLFVASSLQSSALFSLVSEYSLLTSPQQKHVWFSFHYTLHAVSMALVEAGGKFVNIY